MNENYIPLFDNTTINTLALQYFVVMEIMTKRCWGHFLGTTALLM